MIKESIEFKIERYFLDKRIEVIDRLIPISPKILKKISPLKGAIDSRGDEDTPPMNLTAEDNDAELDEIYSPSKLNYYSDANVVVSLYKSNNDDKDKEQLLSINESVTQDLFFRARIDLSILNYTDCDINDKCCVKIMAYYEKNKFDYANINSATNLSKVKMIHAYLLRSVPQYRYLYEINKLYNLGYKKEHLMVWVADKSLFEQDKEKIIDKVIKFINKDLNVSSYKDYAVLKKWLYESKGFGKIVKKYKEKQSSCFAIMEEEDGLKYFALSGIHECERNKGDENYDKIIKVAIELLSVLAKRQCSETDVFKEYCGYKWAYLNDDVLRYVDTTNKYNPMHITYINTPTSLGSHLTAPGNSWEDFRANNGRYFSCCEKKILAHSNNAKDKIFYVRWKPCDLCIPAMFKTKGKKTVHAFAKDFKSYKANKYKDNISIQVYPSA